MIRDKPQAVDLLAEARNVLNENILPALSAQDRYSALMVLRALDLAQNELNARPCIEKHLYDRLDQLTKSADTQQNDYKALSLKIREGTVDASDEIYNFLQLVTAFKLNETDPSQVDKSFTNQIDQSNLDNT